MGQNRFYTPALPKYTSQFVQDQTPWEALFAWEDQKLARTDAALAGSAKAQSQFTSLQPGYRTGSIAPEVIKEFEDELTGWQEKHKGALGSIPAMSDLTKLQGKFQADKRVKMVQQDFAANEYWDRMRSDPNYRSETDPNVYPETGMPKQFTSEDEFNPYANAVYIGDQAKELRERFGHLKMDISEGDPTYETIKDRESGKSIDVLMSRRYGNLGAESEKIVGARKAYVDELISGTTQMGQYYKQLYGEDFTREKAEKIVKGGENQYYVENQLIDSSFVPIGTTTKTDSEDNVYEFDATTRVQVPPDNAGGSGESAISKGKSIGAGFREWRMGLFKGANGENYYQNVKSDPAAMVGGKTIDPETGKTLRRENTVGITNKDIITRAMFEQPYTTISKFDEFWNESLSNSDLSESERKKIEKEKVKYDKYISNAIEKYKIGDPAFNSDIELNKAMSTIAESRAAGFEDIYDGPEIDDIYNLTPEQAVKLRVAKEKYDNEIMDRGYIPGLIGFGEEVQQEFTSRFAGLHVDSNGIVKTDKGIPEQLAGAVIINPEDPNDFIKVEDKKNFYKKGDPLSVTGMYENTRSQYGPGVFSITTGDKNYLVRGPKEFVEPYEFTNVIHTHEHPKNNDEGDYFAFRGISNKGNLDVRYRWNRETKPADAADVWMNVSLDRIEKPDQPRYVVRMFQKDPNSTDDDSYLRLYNEEDNPNGYHNYSIQDEAGNTYNKAERPPDRAVTKKVMGIWLGNLVDNGELSENRATDIYQRAFPVNE